MGNLNVHCEAVSEYLRYLFHYKTLNNNLELGNTPVRYLKCDSNPDFPKFIIFLLDASQSSSGLPTCFNPSACKLQAEPKERERLKLFSSFSGSGHTKVKIMLFLSTS